MADGINWHEDACPARSYPGVETAESAPAGAVNRLVVDNHIIGRNDTQPAVNDHSTDFGTS